MEKITPRLPGFFHEIGKYFKHTIHAVPQKIFLSPIPVSVWLIFCCGDCGDLIKKRNEHDKNTNFLMKNNNKNAKNVNVNRELQCLL